MRLKFYRILVSTRNVVNIGSQKREQFSFNNFVCMNAFCSPKKRDENVRVKNINYAKS
jgi:hypothetical protein